MPDEYRYLMSISETLEAGKWIAIIDDEVVAKGETGKEVFDKARAKHPGASPHNEGPRQFRYAALAGFP